MGLFSSKIDRKQLKPGDHIYSLRQAYIYAHHEYGATASSDPTEYFLHRSLFLLENEFGGCHVFMNNCEDFAIYCKTSLLVVTNICVGQSGQAASCLAAASAPASEVLHWLDVAYCVSRYVSDIGVRCDVAKVPVEKISEMAKED
ncbi:hypothetical protein JHK84_032112 [Glycine max]|nr:hypothetical protein JHK85_032539 [Glycine max]KAG5146569.1 hypothetical protein JHK84_032112 [Glycine max]